MCQNATNPPTRQRLIPRAQPDFEHKTISMRTNPIITILATVVAQAVFGFLPLCAAPFDCGSSGAYGAMNITNSITLNLPPDGVFHCTTITVATGKTLRFTNNALNTPVYLLATGDAVISGTIDMSGYRGNGYSPGKGGPGGFDGGNGGGRYSGQTNGGDGLGPGCGRNKPGLRDASFGSIPPFSPSNTNKYGSLLLCPLIGGSGSAGTDGEPGRGGEGGGGALLLASNTRIAIQGVVKATVPQRISNGDSDDRYSSGGAVRLVAPTVTGAGTVDAAGQRHWNGSILGGYGRIRIDCLDNQAYRSLNLIGTASRGSRMIVFPTNDPQLDIIGVAGQPIAEGTNNSVVIELAVGAPTNQTVLVQARNFTNDVPIRVVVTPENGPAGSFDATILQASGNPPSTNVPVIIPAGSACQIHAWTR